MKRKDVTRVKRAFDGTFTPMMQFLIENEELSDEDYGKLERMIKDRRRSKSASKGKR